MSIYEKHDNNAVINESLQTQLDTGMIETMDGKFCVCLNNTFRHHGWIMSKHPDGQWVSLRMALPNEIDQAIKRIKQIQVLLNIPCKG